MFESDETKRYQYEQKTFTKTLARYFFLRAIEQNKTQNKTELIDSNQNMCKQIIKTDKRTKYEIARIKNKFRME